MKIHGWCRKCRKCRKFKRVNVIYPSTKGVSIGTCDECQQNQERRKT